MHSSVHTWTRARTVAAGAVPALLPERLPLAETVGRVLATPLAALTDLPAFDSSAMDGWAVRGPGPWRVRGGRVLAGGACGALAPGEAVAVATGAQLPAGTSRVLRDEDAERDRPARSAEDAEWDRPARSAEDAEWDRPARSAEDAERDRPARTAEDAEWDRPARSAEDAERDRPARSAEDAEWAEAGRRPGAALSSARAGEQSVQSDALLTARADAAAGRDVRPRGQECRAGDALLPAGTPVTPAVVGLAAACGYDTLAVSGRPTADLLVLGDELLDRGLPGRGRVRDALGPLLVPWLGALGARVGTHRRIPDDLDALCTTLTRSTADVVLTTGGSARGPVDHVRRALDALGARTLVGGVAVRPGHPMLLAVLPDGRPVVGLPGNPLAAVAGTATLAVPVLRALAGLPPAVATGLPAGVRMAGRAPSTALVPVAVRDGAVHPLDFHGPAMLRGLAACDALAVVPSQGAGAGAMVELLPRPGESAVPGAGLLPLPFRVAPGQAPVPRSAAAPAARDGVAA